MFNRILILLCVGLSWSAVALPSQAQTAPATRPAKACALIVVGTPGTSLYARHYRRWAGRFYGYLTAGTGVAAADVVLLSEQKDLPNRSGDATAPAIQAALASLAGKLTSQDQLILILIGHGAPGGSVAIPGPDLTPVMLADSLKAIAAERQVLIDLSSCSGAAIPALAGPGRIMITASGPTQTSDSDFAEFLLRALEGKLPGAATMPYVAGKPGETDLLTVFNAASNAFTQWIASQQQTEDGWVVQGQSFREIFQWLYGGDDVPPGRKLSSDISKALDNTPLTLPPQTDVEFWTGRRLLTEIPLIEDTGKGDGVAATGPEGYKPVGGDQATDVGALARKTILGRPNSPAQ